MTRRFDDTQWATPTAAPAASSVPGFVACNINQYPAPMQQLWHAIYIIRRRAAQLRRQLKGVAA